MCWVCELLCLETWCACTEVQNLLRNLKYILCFLMNHLSQQRMTGKLRLCHIMRSAVPSVITSMLTELNICEFPFTLLNQPALGCFRNILGGLKPPNIDLTTTMPTTENLKYCTMKPIDSYHCQWLCYLFNITCWTVTSASKMTSHLCHLHFIFRDVFNWKCFVSWVVWR